MKTLLQFTEDGILQKLSFKDKHWTFKELLETYEPLPGIQLAERNEAMRRVVQLAEAVYSELSEAGRLCYDFWKQLQSQRIAEQSFSYTTTIVDTYRWELKLTQQGLFYKDISGEYFQTGKVYEQLFSDFWFYGPRMPISELAVRQQVVSAIRNAFLQIGPVSRAHFELFEYPPVDDSLSWEKGDWAAQDFVIVRGYGIDVGSTNWHDGPVFLDFISFERFLTGQGLSAEDFTPKVKTAIQKHLQKALTPEKIFTKPEERNAESKRIFMENGGMHHYIMKDYADVYKPDPGDEERWRKELVANFAERLKTEDKQEVLYHIATALRYNGVANVEEQLVEAAKAPNLKARQAIGMILSELFNSDSAAEITISLLEFEQEEDYWRNYVFSALGRMRDNKAAQRFAIQCLRDNNEIHFKKAVDLLSLWGMKGDNALMDRQLLLALNWEDACATDPDFQQALEKAIKIIER